LFGGSEKKKGKVKGGLNADIEGGLPSVDINVSGPKGGIDTNAEIPDNRFDLKKPKGKVSIEAPKGQIGVSPGKADASINFSGPKLGVDSKLSADVPGAGFDINSPNVRGPDVHGNLEFDHPAVGIGGSVHEGGDLSIPSVKGKVDPSISIEGPNIEGKKPKGAFSVELPQLGFGGKVKAETPLVKGDVSASIDSPHVKAGSRGSQSGIMGFQPDVTTDIQVPQVVLPSASGSVGIQSPSVDVDGRAALTDKKDGSLGRKMKGLFSSKDSKTKLKSNLSADASLDTSFQSTGASFGVTGPEVGLHTDISRPHAAARDGFATSYDASLDAQQKPFDASVSAKATSFGISSHNERAIDVNLPNVRVDASGDASSPSSQSSVEAKGPKLGMQLKIGKSKEKKHQPHIEEGLKDSLPTAGVAGGSVHISASPTTSESQPPTRKDTKKSSSEQ